MSSWPITTMAGLPAPRGWRWALLRDVARLESGHTPSRREPSYWEGGAIPWLSLKDMRAIEGRYVTDTADKPTQAGIDNSSARVLPKGTVAFCRTASVGKVAILGRAMATSQDFANWVCGPEILPEYLFEALRASSAQFDKEKQGTTHKTIYMPVLESFRVLLPPKEEQRRIADILDKADAIRRKRAEAIALTDELLRSTFLEMFGDPVTNPKRWPGQRFEDAVRDATGGNPKLQQGAYQKEGAFPIIDQGADFIGGWTSDPALVARVALPAVLFGDHTKGLKWVERPFVLGADGVKVLVPREALLPEYLYVACQMFPFPDVGYSRHFKFLKMWDVPIPPLDLQRRYATLFRKIRGSLSDRVVAAGHAENLFHALVARAFDGGLS